MRYEQKEMVRHQGRDNYNRCEAIRRIEFCKHKMNSEDLERADRTIAEHEENLPADWRYKHLTGPAA